MKRGGSKKKSTISIDFEGIESGGRAVPDGVYTFTVDSVEEKEGKESGEPYLAFKHKVKGGKLDGATVYDNCSLQPQALWRLKTLLECLGVKVPDGELDLDTDDLIGEEFTAEIVNETREGKKYPRIVSFGGDEPEEDEKPAKKPKGGKPAADDDDDDDDDDDKKGKNDDDDDDDDDDDEDKKPARGSSKKPRIKIGAKAKFEDEKGKTIKATVTEIDGNTVKVEDSRGEEWEIDLDDLTIL